MPGPNETPQWNTHVYTKKLKNREHLQDCARVVAKRRRNWPAEKEVIGGWILACDHSAMINEQFLGYTRTINRLKSLGSSIGATITSN